MDGTGFGQNTRAIMTGGYETDGNRANSVIVITGQSYRVG
jgi:hypothetical protein